MNGFRINSASHPIQMPTILVNANLILSIFANLMLTHLPLMVIAANLELTHILLIARRK